MGARPRRRRRAAPQRRLRRWLRRHGRFTSGLPFAAVALSVLVVALIALRTPEEPRGTKIARDPAPRASGQKPPGRRAPATRIPAAQPHEKVRTPPPKAPLPAPLSASAAAERSDGPRVAIVIDDLGQRFSHFEQLAGLKIPLSIAVIPGLPASARTASEASRRGVEVLLHQPMEPREEGGKNPGEGVLLTTMTAEAIRARVRANLAAVPGAVGVNNHMGSRFTEDAAGLGAVMAVLEEDGLFWLDSRTTAGTRGLEMAHAAGVPALERDIFIDAEVNADFIRHQLRLLIAQARARGAAVGIGHPHPETIAVLGEMRAELLASGVTLIPVSALARSKPGSGSGPALAAARAGGGGETAGGGKTATQ